jgi:hypothetical protein
VTDISDTIDNLSGDAVEKIAQLGRGASSPQIVDVGDYAFSREELHRVDVDAERPEALTFYTLQGLVDFVQVEQPKGALVHVLSPKEVHVIGPLEGVDNHLRRRYAIAACQTGVLGFGFNRPMPLEGLAIGLQTCFSPGRHPDLLDLQKFCAEVRSTEEVGVADDGISQTVQAKSGIAAVMSRAVKNPWFLAPWRTFTEIDQPLSPFVLRFQRGEQPTGGLYETGDGGWQVEAVTAIAVYLREKLGTVAMVLG